MIKSVLHNRHEWSVQTNWLQCLTARTTSKKPARRAFIYNHGRSWSPGNANWRIDSDEIIALLVNFETIAGSGWLCAWDYVGRHWLKALRIAELQLGTMDSFSPADTANERRKNTVIVSCKFQLLPPLGSYVWTIKTTAVYSNYDLSRSWATHNDLFPISQSSKHYRRDSPICAKQLKVNYNV